MTISNKENLKQKLENMPIAIVAISLGFMSISTALVDFNISWVRHFAVLFAIICIGLIMLKYIVYPKKVLEEIKHPILGSIYPTISMTLMVISVYMIQFNKMLGQGLWLFGLILHILISILFFMERFKSFKIIDLIPSWFIPTVGIGIAAVTSKPMQLPVISKLVFYYSLFMFIVVGILMIYRLTFMDKLKGPKRPTLMIIAAPASICLAGYIAISDAPNKMFINALALLAYVTTLGGYILIPKLIKAKPLPALAPLTFPLAIGVIASQRYVKYLGKVESSMQGLARIILYVQLIIAIAVIGYVVFRTIQFLINTFKPKKELVTQVNKI